MHPVHPRSKSFPRLAARVLLAAAALALSACGPDEAADVLGQSSCALAGDPCFDWPMGGTQGGEIVPGWNSYIMQNYANRGGSGWYNNRAHSGIDMALNSGATAGAPVYAAADGVVRCVVNANYPGWVTVIEHTLGDGSKKYTQYGHTSAPSVALNATVTRGQQIATILNQAGNSHLHFEVRNWLYWQGNTANCYGPGYAEGTYQPDQQGWANPVDWHYGHRAAFPGLGVTDISQNVRNAPSTGGTIIATLTPGVRYTVDQVTSDQGGGKEWWYRIQYATGQWGWAAGYSNSGWGGEVYVVEPRRSCGSAPPPTTYVVDDLSSGFTKFGPTTYWYQASIGYASHMWWTYVNGTVKSNYAQWKPTLLAGAGNYEVQAHIPSNYATSQQARYRIYHQGTNHYFTVNQNAYYNVWVSLGTYAFSANGTEYVELSDDTGEAVGTKMLGFDAIQFIKK